MNLWPNSSGEAQSWVSLDSELAHLQNLEIGQSVGPVFNVVLFHMFDPLDMGLGTLYTLQTKSHIAPTTVEAFAGSPAWRMGRVVIASGGDTERRGAGRDTRDEQMFCCPEGC